MCESEKHWCSNCGSDVDSGKSSEYLVLDFMVNLMKGKPRTRKRHGDDTRSVICKKCQAQPVMKELLEVLDGLKKLPKFKPDVIKEKISGALQCSRCQTVITDETPHVSLNISWDVNYEKLEEKDHVLCKACYNKDERTRRIWQFLAKLGKNPTFEPRITCASAAKCATFRRGPFPFECQFIEAHPFTEKKQVTATTIEVTDGFKLQCGRRHRKAWKLPATQPVIINGTLRKGKVKRGVPLVASGAAPQNTQMAKMMKVVVKNIKRMRAAAKTAKDPGIRAVLQSQADLLAAVLGPMGYEALLV